MLTIWEQSSHHVNPGNEPQFNSFVRVSCFCEKRYKTEPQPPLSHHVAHQSRVSAGILIKNVSWHHIGQTHLKRDDVRSRLPRLPGVLDGDTDKHSLVGTDSPEGAFSQRERKTLKELCELLSQSLLI